MTKAEVVKQLISDFHNNLISAGVGKLGDIPNVY